MKDLRPLIYILLIPLGIVSVLFIITLFALAMSNYEPVKELFSMTGTIGDTLGGITTCLVSGLTLYYIITTFKDQSSINQHSRSSNNFSINYELLRRIEQEIEKLQFEYFNRSQWGLSSIPFFNEWIMMSNLTRAGSYGNLIAYDFWNRLNDNEFKYFSKIIEILNKLEYWAENLNKFQLENEHKEFLFKEFYSIFNPFFYEQKAVINKFYFMKGFLSGEENFNHNVNLWFSKLLENQKIMENLLKMGVIQDGEGSDSSNYSLKFDFNSSSLPFKIDKSIFDKI
ncbi:hypothetical protein GCM10011514_47190 [Emticicia aquatilis]|uniref:Phage abortive infection protein n=1 Tax=Emticicia aquatilis TaxID=1537369 RepID=A0A916Z6P0_9BACT|nr:hypothetical protein [Emticicia aquatilis]GGD77799.1 hypothetical protein GCM10011514_47190 [Emticicia aquatilis]